MDTLLMVFSERLNLKSNCLQCICKTKEQLGSRFLILQLIDYGGEAGIRTLGGDQPSTVFKTAAFGRSATSPQAAYNNSPVLKINCFISFTHVFKTVSKKYWGGSNITPPSLIRATRR
jgi:hypothetical protein